MSVTADSEASELSGSSKQETQVGVPRIGPFRFLYFLLRLVAERTLDRNSLVLAFFVFLGVSSESNTLRFGSDTNLGLRFLDLFNALSDRVLSLLASEA